MALWCELLVQQPEKDYVDKVSTSTYRQHVACEGTVDVLLKVSSRGKTDFRSFQLRVNSNGAHLDHHDHVGSVGST